MSDADRKRWDQRYRDGSYRARPRETVLLQEWQPELPPGRALDLACGAGRNALYLAACGYEVDAVDISPFALEQARAKARERELEVNWMEADLDDFVPEIGQYDLIVVARYVNRRLLPRLAAGLKPGGALVYEHHFRTDLEVDGPKDPEFRLAPGELRQQLLPRGSGDRSRRAQDGAGAVGGLSQPSQVIAAKVCFCQMMPIPGATVGPGFAVVTPRRAGARAWLRFQQRAGSGEGLCSRPSRIQ
jgi:SAM-dependent methyltransferase